MTRVSVLGLASLLLALPGCQKKSTKVPDEVADADAEAGDNAPAEEEDFAPSEEVGGGTEEEEEAPNLGKRPLR